MLQVLKKGLVDIPLDGRAAMGGSEGHAETPGGDELFGKTGGRQYILCHLAGIIRHRSHGLPLGTIETIVNGIINRTEYTGMNVTCQKAIITEWPDP